MEEAIRGLKEETEDANEVVEDFLDKIEYAVVQASGRILERDDVKQQIDKFAKEIREKTEEIMDTASYGPFSAFAFLTLILDTDGPYTSFLRELEGKSEISPPVNIPGYLIGWIAGKSSENLKIIFNEMTAELKNLYSKHFIPLPSINSWEELWNEFERMGNSPKFEKILKKDTASFSELKDAAKVIKQSYENPYTETVTPEKIKNILSTIEGRSAGNIKKTIDEMRPLEEELKQIEEDTKGLSWWKRLLPKNRVLLRKRESVGRRLGNVRQGLQAEANAVVKKVQKLLPCYAFLAVYEKLNEELMKLDEEVRGFTDALNMKVVETKTKMNTMEFPSDSITHQIACKDEDDIKALYHTNSAVKDIPEIFDKFLEPLKPSKLSTYYQRDKREYFLNRLHSFAHNNFLYLNDWSAEQLIIYLNREEECMTTLQNSCRPFIGIEKIKVIPELKLMECLYIGVEDEDKTKLNSHSLSLKSETQFYSTGDTSQIIGLRLLHGFPVSLIEGWLDWENATKDCLDEIGNDSRDEIDS